MPHILFIYKQFPAPHVGHAGGESLFYLMQGLHQRGWHISLVARIRDDEKHHLDEVQAICDHIITTPHHRSLPGWRPYVWLKSYFALRRVAKQAMRTLKPDCIHVETTQTAMALAGLRLPPSSFRTQDVNWHLFAQKMEHQSGLRRHISGVLRRLLRWLEPVLYNRYDVLLAISKGDRAILDQAMGRSMHLVPLRPLAEQHSEPAIAEGDIVIFVGAMSRDHNVDAVRWFLDEVWDSVVARMPDARFYIIGGNPPEEIVVRDDGTHVFVTGYVGDLDAWYAAATVFVSPMLVAGGLLQKVVDAMSLGVPVVSTSVCNHGIGAIPGEDIILADDAIAFADAVVNLLQSPEQAAKIRDAARRYITQVYDFENAVDMWDNDLHRLIRGTNTV